MTTVYLNGEFIPKERATISVGELDGVQSAPLLRASRWSKFIHDRQRRSTHEIAMPLNVKISSAAKNARIPGSTAINSVSTR